MDSLPRPSPTYQPSNNDSEIQEVRESRIYFDLPNLPADPRLSPPLSDDQIYSSRSPTLAGDSRFPSRAPTISGGAQSSASSFYFSDKKTVEPPFHVFSARKKKALMYLVSVAGIFSSLSSNIYFPALGQISRNLHVSESTLSLTITIYMVVQGLAPSFWGPLSDAKGRRPAFIGTFLIYLAANIGLAFSTNFTQLMVFRGFQAAGSAATISIGAGVIADIATPKERGDFNAKNQGIRMFGLAIGPVFGGVISQYLGYHAIFWFLFGFGALNLAFIILLLPETLRSIAGNGTLLLKTWYRPVIYKYTQPDDDLVEHDLPPKKKLSLSMIFTPLKLLLEKDVFLFILYGSYQYTVWSMVSSTTTTLFQRRFSLNDLEIGLIFLPNGFGSILGSIVTGKIMVRDYTILERRYRLQHGIPEHVKLNKKEMIDFPFEKARLRNVWWMVALFILSTGLYGFSLYLNILALPLIAQFFISYAANSVFALNQTLVVDLYPEMGASATAVNNLMRCSLGAAGVAVVQPIIDSLGSGPTFALFAGLTVALTPILVVEWFYGEGWRRARKERLDRQKKEKAIEQVETGTVKCVESKVVEKN